MSKKPSSTVSTVFIDLEAGQLRRGDSHLLLRPKTWAVLQVLLDHPGALVTKDQLLDAVWPDAVVGEGTLNKSIAELRAALEDDTKAPRFVETVARRGFRWLGGIDVVCPSVTESIASPPASAPSTLCGESDPTDTAYSLVGRDEDLAAMHRAFAVAASGKRQVLFVTGEAGAGKTTLVDAFLTQLEQREADGLTAQGQCIEAYGQHEPYRPLLEAVERLAKHSRGGQATIEALRTDAPTWLRQMPSLSTAAAVDGAAAIATPDRMLREISVALEGIARKQPLVLILEDAHWADLATTDACNMLARRRDPACLLVVITMRSADALVAEHPVLATKSDLVSRGLATEIPLEPFTAASVSRYLEERCTGLDLEEDMALWIHRQTAGNPLFVRILIDDLIHRGMVAVDETQRWHLRSSSRELREFVPDSLRELVDRQMDSLATAERSIVEAASVLQGSFTAGTIAAMVGAAEEDTEDLCTEMTRRGQILKKSRQLSARNVSQSDRFAFVHSMVQRILHDQIPATRLRRLHRAAAEQLELGQSGREEGTAVRIALHYSMAEDAAAAIAHLQRAAASVQQIPAPREVIVIREQILDLVQRNPHLPGHRRERLVATMALAQARQLASAVVDEETTALCETVLSLATTEEDGRERFLASMGVFSSRFYTGRYAEARDIGRMLLVAAQRHQHPFMIKSADFAIAGSAYRMGEFVEARTHFEACLHHSAESKETYGWDFQSMSLSHLALIRAHCGQPDQARQLIDEAIEYDRRDDTPDDAAPIPMLAYALATLGDDKPAIDLVERALSQADRAGAAAWIERARFLQGLLVSRQDKTDRGVRMMKESLARQARQPVYLDRTAYCAILAEEILRLKLDGAQAVLSDGFAYMERSGERHFEAELYRVQGDLLAAEGGDAEAHYRRAIAAAQRCGASTHEVAAVQALERLLGHGQDTGGLEG